MRSNLLCGRGGVSFVVDEDTRHSLPIAQMGNYQDYLKKQPMPLRELESPPVRQHMFGNPFKTNKNLMMMTDEVGLGGVDEVQIANSSGAGQSITSQSIISRGVKRPAGEPLSAPPKKRKGPLSKDFKLQSQSSSPIPKRDFPSFDVINQVEIVDLKSASAVNVIPGVAVQPPIQPPPPQLNHVNGNKPTILKQPPEPLPPPSVPCKISGFEFDNEDKVVVKDDAAVITNHKLENFKNNILKKSLDFVPNNSANLGTKTIADASTHSWLNHNGQSQSDSLQHKAEHTFSNLLNTQLPKINQELNPPRENLIENNKHVLRGGVNIAESFTNSITSNLVTNGPSVLDGGDKSLTEDELRSIKLRNNNVRQLIYKEVKRPGKLHLNLWKMLEELHGPAWIKKQFIQEVKQEALR